MKFHNAFKSILFILILLFGISCRGGLVSVSERLIDIKEDGNKVVRSREISPATKPPEIYVKKTTINLQPKSTANNTGSLYRIDDPRNVLFTEIPRGFVDDVLDVKVASLRLPATDEQKPDDSATNKEANAQAAKAPAESEDDPKALERTLLKSLPELDAGENSPEILKSLKMRVTQTLPNGDALVSFNRQSTTGVESNAISVTARVPAKSLLGKGEITTNHLQDVQWAQSEDGEMYHKESYEWEDDYTLRLSGFSEAKSKRALALEEKRKQLGNVKKQVETNLKNMTAQRLKIAQERQRLIDERAKMQKEREDLNTTIKTREAEIQEKSQEIETLKQSKKEVEEEFATYQKEVATDQAAADAAADEKEEKDE